MHAVYTNPRTPGSFGGVEVLRRYARKPRRAVVEYLASQDAYTLHKPTRIHFPRRRTYSNGIADLYQIDLADMSQLSTYNDGYRYLLNCIDVFTKRAWSVPLKSKTGREVSEAFERHILSERPCNMVQSDKGTEFLNSNFQSMLRRHGIKFYTSENEDIKAAVVERFNRTLKQKMYRYFTAKRTRRYVDVLSDLIYSYNNTYHRSIGMSPSEVTTDNEDEVRARLYPAKRKTLNWKFKVGDKVRISMHRRPFKKGYVGNWSEELFVVDSRLPTAPVTYRLKDLTGDDIKGAFYSDELQFVSKPDDALFDVERVVRTRKRAGKIEYLVKWRGYSDKFNSWVDTLTGTG